MRASCFVTRPGWTSEAVRKSCMSVPARATCWIHGSGSNDRKNLKLFEDSAPRFSPRVCRPRWNWRVRSGCPFPARRSPKGCSNAYWRLIERYRAMYREFPKSLTYLWNHPDLSQKTKEKIAYHNGKEYFQLDRPVSASAGRKAN